MKRKDIRAESDEEKEKAYQLVDDLYKLGIPVKVKEHKSGFPAVTVDCGGIHLLTDCLSLEQWWSKRKQQGQTED